MKTVLERLIILCFIIVILYDEMCLFRLLEVTDVRLHLCKPVPFLLLPTCWSEPDVSLIRSAHLKSLFFSQGCILASLPWDMWVKAAHRVPPVLILNLWFLVCFGNKYRQKPVAWSSRNNRVSKDVQIKVSWYLSLLSVCQYYKLSLS